MNLERVINLFKSADPRDSMLRNNILLSGLFKIIGLCTSLLIVPVTLDYLDNEAYGIWMTITSILYMITTSDIGLGNGLRNYLTEAISLGDYQLAKSYLSTSLIALSIIAAIIAVGSIIPFITLNFNSVFNTTLLSNEILRLTLVTAVGFTLINFVIKNIGYIFVAMQHYAINDLLVVIGNVLSLLIIFILTKTTKPNLLYVVVTLTATPVAVYIIASIPIFRHYKTLRPSFGSFDKKLLRDIVTKSIGFFVIQITSCMVIFGSSNLFITHFCGPTAVTPYNIAYKYFNLLIIAYTILISPMWNAYTDAYVKKDFGWISKTFNRALKFWLLSIALGVVMLLGSDIFFRLWIGDKVKIPLALSCAVLFYVSMFNFNNCVTYLINGLNKIRIQIITSLGGTALYLGIVSLQGAQWGVLGIVFCMGGIYCLMALVHFYQCRLLINNKAKGIWNK